MNSRLAHWLAGNLIMERVFIELLLQSCLTLKSETESYSAGLLCVRTGKYHTLIASCLLNSRQCNLIKAQRMRFGYYLFCLLSPCSIGFAGNATLATTDTAACANWRSFERRGFTDYYLPIRETDRQTNRLQKLRQSKLFPQSESEASSILGSKRASE